MEFQLALGLAMQAVVLLDSSISGLSNLQIKSLKAVVGFFIGGLIMSHFILLLLFLKMKVFKYILLDLYSELF